MIKTSNFTLHENIDLSKEIALVAPMDTPLTTLLLNKKLVEDAGSVTINWREKTLDETADISKAEGFTVDTFVSSGRAEKSNVMEIFSKAVQVSGSAQASNVLGINDLFASEINDRLTEVKVNIEKKMLASTNYNDGSTAPYIRRMKSIFEQADPGNIIDITTAPSLSDFKAVVKKLWDNGLGSNEFYCFVNADFKEVIDTFYANQINYNMPMNTFGFVANKVITNYGIVNIVLNRHMPVDKILVVDPAYLRLSYLRKPAFETLAKDGDNMKGMVITECSLKVLNSKAVAIAQ
ncbi:hypothetical protein SAMN05443428_13910 [Caloramator quimbayensis]|uniref:Phage major capsid protein, HK97 family n=1 Tax=Caloramator quimbayensis TaxID=1147123 RepID=A0A1T4YDM3_9CLOT|nr:DUF5309 family protein [Caloramator quimbayensis]SKA99922.1 hypothetical protein SAMN05443428_13910 [Caloramator quimbayensis]